MIRRVCSGRRSGGHWLLLQEPRCSCVCTNMRIYLPQVVSAHRRLIFLLDSGLCDSPSQTSRPVFQPEMVIQPVNNQRGNDLEQRKTEFQQSLVETTFDLRALTFTLQQVETVSEQPVGAKSQGPSSVPSQLLPQILSFCSDKHGADSM